MIPDDGPENAEKTENTEDTVRTENLGDPGSATGADRPDDPDGRAAAAARQHAAPASARPRDLAAGVDPLPEVPGGPQIDVPALRGHVPDRDEEERPGGG